MSSVHPILDLEAERIRKQASAWLVTLRSAQRSSEMELEFRSWLDADPAHRKAFFAVTQTWELLGAAGEDLRSDRRRRRIRNQRLAMAASVVLAVAIGVTTRYLTTPVETFATAHGEQRTVLLKDGSRLALNTDTKVVVKYLPHRRSLRLEQGEAEFDVAHDEKRPFVVSVAGEEVTAIGTSFIVKSLAVNQLDVTLMEGRLKLTRPNARGAGPQAVIMTAGQRWTLKSGVQRLRAEELEEVAAWRRGQVIFDKTSLPQAVAEMNRYARRPVRLDVSEAEDYEISGVFRFDDGRAFAAALAALYGLSVQEDSEAIHILGRPQSQSRGLPRDASVARSRL